METSTYEQTAVIDNVGIVEVNEVYKNGKRYSIVSDWSYEALDKFYYLDDARDFICGFKKQPTDKFTQAYRRGRVFRRCVDSDLKEFGHTYHKKIDIKKQYKEILVD